MATRTLIAAILIALMPALTTFSVAHAQPKRGVKTDPYAGTAVAATNDQRAAAGLPTLKRDRCLQRFAARQAARMAKQREMFHQDLSPILRKCHVRSVGENVAYGFGSGASVVNDGWMNSAGHRANILDRNFRLVAVAAHEAGGRWYVAQVFGRR